MYVVLGEMGVHVHNMKCGGVHKSGVDLYRTRIIMGPCTFVQIIVMSAFQGVRYEGFHCSTCMYSLSELGSVHTYTPCSHLL